MNADHDKANDGLRPRGRRALRAVFAADVAGFSAQVSVDETATFHSIMDIREVAIEQLNLHHGWLFGMPGDGIFALFESAIDAVNCGLGMQELLAANPKLEATKLRIGIHLGEVLFEKDLPFGEALAIAARLESLADPGGILVSSSVFDAVSARVSALFEPRGVPQLKNIPRRLETFAVKAIDEMQTVEPDPLDLDLDKTTKLDRAELRKVRDDLFGVGGTDGHLTYGEKQDVDAHQRDVPQKETNQHTELRCNSPLDVPFSELEHVPATSPQLPPELPPKVFGGQDLPEVNQSAEDGVEVPPKTSLAEQAAAAEAVPGVSGIFLSPELKELLVGVLATHVGPLARLVVERNSALVSSLDELVERLEQEVPSGHERMAFRLRATQIVLNSF